MAVEYLPLVVATLLMAVVALAPVNRTVDRALNRLAFGLFDGREIEPDSRRERVLRSAGDGTPYRLYAARTYLLTVVGAVCGVVFGLYVGALVADLVSGAVTLPIGADRFDPLPAWLVAPVARSTALTLSAGLILGGLSATGVYLVRWKVPAVRAETRRRQIDAGLPRMVAFVYALSRGGMAFPDVMRALSENRGVFGTGAEEVRVGVRNIDLFGDDLVSAVRDLARRTPSEQFQKFAENLTSVLQSGQDLSSFLHDEYERYNEAAEEQQREILDLLSATAEIYVTVVVAGMLFLITILLVIGLTTGGMLLFIELITYLVLPATNVLFVAYLSEITQPLRASRERFDAEIGGQAAGARPLPVAGTTRPDGGSVTHTESVARVRNRARFAAHERLRSLRETLKNPLATLVDEPTLLLYVTVPLSVFFLANQLPAALTADGFDVGVYDDAVIQATLFVLATFAAVYEVHRRRLDRLEDAVPYLLERLASLNEAGVAIVSSIERVRRSDLGELDAEVDRIWRDVRWGATVGEALERFERRVETPSVTRVVTLLTNAMHASNEIGPVLRIAADQARNDRRLKRRRRQEMFTYLVIIYVAFLVFLIVIGTIDYVLIPNLPSADPTAGAGDVISRPGVVSIGNVDTEAHKRVFFHAGIIQATMSGLVGGQMGRGSIKDGAKHATVMLAIAYVVFTALERLTAGGAIAL